MAKKDEEIKTMTNSTDNSEVLRELRGIKKLLALMVVEGKPQNEKVLLLDQVDFTSPEIGDLLGITANAVRLTRHQALKRGKKANDKNAKEV